MDGMKNVNYSISTLLSVFRRKGAEGSMTRIVDKYNQNTCEILYSDYLDGETSIILVHHHSDYWFILTNYRIILNEDQALFFVWYNAIDEVKVPLFREIQLGRKNKEEFTQIELTFNQNQQCFLTTERGLPYVGIFHLLQYVKNKNTL